MKKTYIRPQSTAYALAASSMLAVSGSSTDEKWTSEDLPEGYEEIGFGSGTKVPD
ncbi:MAG: hypothetical protein ACI3YA_07190 [Alloprevotella sp.]